MSAPLSESRPQASLYRRSSRTWDGILRSPDYPAGTVIRKVRRNGEIKWKGNCIFVSEVLAAEPVGLTEIADDVWLLKYGLVALGTIRGRAGLIRVASRTRKRPALSPQQT